jgi:hypothetical protein
MDTTPDNPHGSCTLIWLEQQDFYPMADMSRRTASRMAQVGAIPGTEGRYKKRYDNPWPILLTKRLEGYIQKRRDTLRRLKVIAERKALAEKTGASLAPLTSILDGADAIKTALWIMAERRTMERLSRRDIQRMERDLREPARSLPDFHKALRAHMTAAGIVPLADV